MMNKSSPIKKRSGRYAVLRHENVAHPHFDFLLEVREGAPLKTWRLMQWPLTAGDRSAATPLPDHRNLYLEYEGPLTGGRGVVFHVEGGACEFARSNESPTDWRVWIGDACIALGETSAKCELAGEGR